MTKQATRGIEPDPLGEFVTPYTPPKNGYKLLPICKLNSTWGVLEGLLFEPQTYQDKKDWLATAGAYLGAYPGPGMYQALANHKQANRRRPTRDNGAGSLRVKYMNVIRCPECLQTWADLVELRRSGATLD